MKFWNYLMYFAESFGKARAAATLTRLGKYEEAKALMLMDAENHVKP